MKKIDHNEGIFQDEEQFHAYVQQFHEEWTAEEVIDELAGNGLTGFDVLSVLKAMSLNPTFKFKKRK